MNARPPLNRLSFALVLALASGLIGCGGNGGSSRADAQVSCDRPVPPCLAGLPPCTPAGACTLQSSVTASAACFANGVKLFTTRDSVTGAADLRWVNGTGSTCYTETVTVRDGGSVLDTIIKDPSGATLATGTSGSDGTVTITCGGQTYDLGAFGCSGDGGRITLSDCAAGTCQ